MKNLTTKKSTNYLSSEHQNIKYKSTISRRESLKWLGVLSSSLALPAVTGCASLHDGQNANKGHWPDLKLEPITVKGYGKDPNMVIPPSSPWPKTLTAAQLTLVAVLADIIVPRDGDVPSATEVNVPDVIDEWVSAPYYWQQKDRLNILSGLAWIDDESALRFSQPFVQLSEPQQLEIIEDIAYQKKNLTSEFKAISDVFNRFRELVLAAFFCSPAGTQYLGYQGNVPIIGDYPGPTDEAMVHFNKVLVELAL